MRRKSVLYLDVAEQIKADIMNGTYPVGSLLPTEAELEQLFDVSKITVRRAIELLSSEELVEKKVVKGQRS
ncbi:GntR family transcriptional regulator [Enterococcus termitis]